MTFDEAISRFPEFLREDLASTAQPPDWHPEGSVMAHTKLVWEALEQTDASIELKIAALFHDLGKIDKTRTRADDGRIVAYGHEMLAARYIDTYGMLFPEVTNWKKIRFVCRFHMIMHRIDEMRAFKREELMANEHWNDLVVFAKADCEGR